MTVATAEDIKGPFQIINQTIHPGGMNSGDFTLVKRENGSAVIIFERVHSDMICMDLTEDYLDVTAEYSVHFPRKCPPFVREAPAVFKHEDKYYIYTSGTTAKFPNPSEVACFTDFHGEWKELGDPYIEDVCHTSFDSQISCVFKYPYAEDLYIVMADRWLVDLPADRPDIPAIFESQFNPEKRSELSKFDLYSLTAKNTSIADYVWLPVKFIDGVPCIAWLDEWKIEDYIKQLYKVSNLFEYKLGITDISEADVTKSLSGTRNAQGIYDIEDVVLETENLKQKVENSNILK